MKDRPVLLSWLLLIFLATVWGSSFILMKKGLVALSPIQVTGVRLTVASLTLLPFLFIYFKKIRKGDWLWLVLSGIFGNGIPGFLFPLAETKISSAVAGILNSLSPLFVLLIAWLMFGKKSSTLRVIGVLTGFAGAIILVGSGGEIKFGENVRYSLLIVLATLCYGLSANIMKEKLSHLSPITLATFQICTIGIPVSFYLMFGTNFTEVIQTHEAGWASVGYIAILGAIGTAFSVILFTKLLQMTDAVFASSVTYLIPVIALIWGFLAGESIQWLHLIGFGVVISGVYLVNKK